MFVSHQSSVVYLLCVLKGSVSQFGSVLIPIKQQISAETEEAVLSLFHSSCLF